MTSHFLAFLIILPLFGCSWALSLQQKQGEGLLPSMKASGTASGAVSKRQAELAGLKARAEQTRRREKFAAQYKDPSAALAGCQGFACVQRYVSFDDGAFSWSVSRGPIQGQGWQRWELLVHSQAWMTASTGVLWTHHLAVVVPEDLIPESRQAGWAILSLEPGPPGSGAEEIATRTGAIAVGFGDVPNQDLNFFAEGRFQLDEETLKAWSWVQYGHHPDHPEWPVEMPCVKAVVRGLDAVMAFTKELSSALPHVLPVEQFIVTGESKRGITTYMAGTVDSRVQGIVALVQPMHQTEVSNATASNLGGLQESVRPYLVEGFYDLSFSEKQRVNAVIDPFNYMDRLTMPKLILNAGNDEFWPPDASRAFYPALPEPKSFLMTGNAHHGGYEANPFMLDEAAVFMKGLMLGWELPQVNWTVSPVSGTISARHVRGPLPSAVRLWRAYTPTDTVRDFREATWTPAMLLPATDGRWLAQVAPAPGHWTGFYIEFEYPMEVAGSGPSYRLSTEVSVVPLTRPFPGASPAFPEFQRIV